MNTNRVNVNYLERISLKLIRQPSKFSIYIRQYQLSWNRMRLVWIFLSKVTNSDVTSERLNFRFEPNSELSTYQFHNAMFHQIRLLNQFLLPACIHGVYRNIFTAINHWLHQFVQLKMNVSTVWISYRNLTIFIARSYFRRYIVPFWTKWRA